MENQGCSAMIYRSKIVRRKHITGEGNSGFYKSLSAIIEIQRIARGFLVRHGMKKGSKFKVIKTDKLLKIDPQKHKRLRSDDRVHLQSLFRKKFENLHLRYLVNFQQYLIYEQACVAIQKAYRKHRLLLAGKLGTRKKYLDKRGKVHFFNPKDEAAAKIQRAWKRYLDRQVFSFYKNLLRFKELGEPREVLRLINPREAKLIDKASSIHIRFRLGGHSFPPMIFYKIFTHGPLCDVGAFAPRNYTKEDAKKDPNVRFNKVTLGSGINPLKVDFSQIGGEGAEESGTNDWYNRVENNNWRPINDDLVTLITEGEERKLGKLTKAKFIRARIQTARKKRQLAGRRFHFSKLVRRQDLQKRRKERKLKWMKKMYSMAKNGIIEARPGMQKMIKKKKNAFRDIDDTGDLDDAEVTELLKWGDALDFDKYIDDWERKGLVAQMPLEDEEEEMEERVFHDGNRDRGGYYHNDQREIEMGGELEYYIVNKDEEYMGEMDTPYLEEDEGRLQQILDELKDEE